jgi:hypothetical protein
MPIYPQFESMTEELGRNHVCVREFNVVFMEVFAEVIKKHVQPKKI